MFSQGFPSRFSQGARFSWGFSLSLFQGFRIHTSQPRGECRERIHYIGKINSGSMLLRSANMLMGSGRAFVPAWVSAASLVSRSAATSTSACSALAAGAAEAGCSTFVTHDLQPQVPALFVAFRGFGGVDSGVCCGSLHSIAPSLAGKHMFASYLH